MLKEGLNAYRQYIRKSELQNIDEKIHIRTCGCYYYFHSHTRNRFYCVTFKLEDIHQPKFCTITFFLYFITQTLETVNADLKLDYLHLLKPNFNNYT